jgi:hypothetical protein
VITKKRNVLAHKGKKDEEDEYRRDGKEIHDNRGERVCARVHLRACVCVRERERERGTRRTIGRTNERKGRGMWGKGERRVRV